ncbi:MAG: PAS domain S-box protein, partial [Chloroflexi bacterium]|nr:PAS domain S-box protein [Chloroflexota bacterium]
RALVIMAAIIIAFVAISYAVSQGILLQGFARVEQERTGSNVERALSALGTEISNIDAIANDWAAWDDSYVFIQDRNQEYLRVNVVDSTFTRLRLNLMLYANTTGQVVFARGFDFNAEQEMPVSQGLQEYLAENGALLRFPNEESSVSGIIMLPEGPMLVASRPILTSQGEGPMRGALLMGRYLDPEETRRIGDVTHLSLSLHPLTGSPLSPQLQAARSSLLKGETTFVQAANEDIIAGYGLLRDINGNPALILKIEQPRDIYQQGVASAGYLILAITAVVLLSGVSVVLLMEKLVLSRLRHLNASVAGIGSSDTSTRVSVAGNDEISSLAESINGMLERIEKSLAALRDSEERFRVAAESISDLIWEWNVKGGTVLWFGDIDGILGYQPGEFPRTLEAWEKAVHPDDHDWVMEALQRGADGIAPYDVKYRVLRKDGSISYWTDRGTATALDQDGHAQVMVGACSDVTARELAVDALQKSEERYRTVLDDIEDNYFEVDLAGNMTFANDATCRTLGYPHEELMEMNYRVFIAEEDKEPLYRSFNTVYLTGKMLKGVSYDIVRKDGSRGTGEFAISLRRNEKGEAIGFRGIGRDITERKKAEQALRESELRYEQLAKHSRTFTWETNVNGLYTYVSHIAQDVTGYNPEELIGQMHFYDIHPEAEREAFKRSAFAVFKNKGHFLNLENPIQAKDGHIVWVSTNGIPILDSNGTLLGYRGSDSDITEQKRAEEALRRSEQKYQELVEGASVGIATADTAGRITFVNQTLRQALGYNEEEIEGKPVLDFVHPDD